MVMNSSGPIDLHAGTAGRSIATELGVSGAISLEGSAARGLAGIASGAITMPTDFYGKSTFAANLQVYTTVGTTNLTIPTGCRLIQWIIVGGGGAGGGIDTGTGANTGWHCGGGGGAGGGQTGGRLVLPGNSLTLVIGAGGSSGLPDPNNWTSGGTSSLTYAGLTYTSNGGTRGYFSVKAGTIGTGGASGSPTATAGGAGTTSRGSGGGGGAGGAGGPGQGVTELAGVGGAGGAESTFAITGLSFTGCGGGGGGGTYAGGAAGGPSAGSGNAVSSDAQSYGGGGGGAEGQTPAGFGGTAVGGTGYQGAIAIWYE